MDGTTSPRSAEKFWDQRYASADRVFSGRPNEALVRESAGLSPGRALDLGCGEGGDAVWLARQGWHVTGVDVSSVALARVARAAEEAGVADRVVLERHDLSVSFPAGTFDLVTTHFLHSPEEVDMPRARILREGAAAVAPGGTLLVVGHTGPASWEGLREGHGVELPSPAQVHRDLGLPADVWEVLVAETSERRAAGPDGAPGTRPDGILKLRRVRG
jgi:SAM-dependent methyltransferase